MTLPLLVVFVVTGVALGGGLAYTLRYFLGSTADATGADNAGGDAPEAAHAIAPHDHATTELLKRFFDGKECAICSRPIPPVHRTGLKPGLWNPATREAQSWDEIPNEHLSAVLETELPLCSHCQVAESFRRRFPDLVVDRERTDRDAHLA